MRSFRAAGVSPIYSVSFPARVLQTEYAGIAQSVEQLIRNQQVVCSSHITSSTSEQASYRLLRLFSKVTARSLRCSSFPKRTRFAGLRFGHYGGLPDRALFSSVRRTPAHQQTIHARASFVSLAPTFFKSHSALAPLLLLPKTNPLRWASFWPLRGGCRTERFFHLHSVHRAHQQTIHARASFVSLASTFS